MFREKKNSGIHVLVTIKILGCLLARLPTAVVEALAGTLGSLLFLLPGRRRRVLLSNLHHAFPEKPMGWHRRVALESCRRTIEMGLLVLALPFLSERQLQARIRMPSKTRRTIHQWLKMEKPVVLLVPHFTLLEYLPMLPIFFEVGDLKAGAIFRPLDNPKIDAWIRSTRERHGLKLLSRKAGFDKAKEILASNGVLGILFDQNAGRSGTLMGFFNRAASTTDLPALMAKRFDAQTYVFHPHRSRFWEATVHLHRLDCSTEDIAQTANDWLQAQLSESEDTCADWLWLHNRWKTANHPTQRFQLANHRKISIRPDRPLRGYRLWIRMPNWLGDVVMALPLLQALRNSRPDAEFTLLCQPAYIPLLQILGIGDAHIPLPHKRTPGYFQFFKHLRDQFPDTQLLLTNSTRGDLEARHIGAPQRFGLVLPGRPRPLLTHTYQPPQEIRGQLDTLHQTRLWEHMLRHFGLQDPIPDAPFQLPDTRRRPAKTGFIAGSSNNPEKCWPPQKWIQLAHRLLDADPQTHIHLYGTQDDRQATAQIADALPEDRVHDHAGQTDLPTLARELSTCAHVLGNDTGGMHLANALGTPVTVLCGPTNPLVTGPFFDAPRTIVQPAGTPQTGGVSIHDLGVEQVIDPLS